MTTLKVNGIEITAKHFAFDGCHKIYLINSEADREDCERCGGGYELLPIEQLQKAYEGSCGLQFINNCDLSSSVVPQGQEAVFEGFTESGVVS